MSSHYPQILKREIIALSQAQDWDIAKAEWSVSTIFFDEEGAKCLCTYNPINKCCVIVNQLNSNRTIVGSVCVKQFLGHDFDLEFDSIKRLKKKTYDPMNSALIQYVRKQQWLNSRELKFYYETFRRRNLTQKQYEWRRRLNERVINQMCRKHIDVRSAG